MDQALSTFTEGEAQRPSRFVPTSAAAIASEQDILDTFVKAGIITTGFDIGDFWSTSFIEDLTGIEGQHVGG